MQVAWCGAYASGSGSPYGVFGNYKRLDPPMLGSTSHVLRAGHVEGGHSSAVYGMVVASVYQVVWRSAHVFVCSVVRDRLGYRCTAL